MGLVFPPFAAAKEWGTRRLVRIRIKFSKGWATRLLSKMTGLTLFTVVLLNFCVGIAAKENKANSTVDTTVCELVQHSSRFYKKAVRVRARVVTDIIEHTLVVDESCPSQGVSLWTTSAFRQRVDYRELRNAIVDEAAAGSKIKKVTATITGRFMRRREGSRHKIVLEAEKIDDVEVVK
jgi:hypothetical protein